MYRLNKNISSKSGERIEFKFSHFKALQVPKGWDKLFLSIVSVETGKTLKKTSKALVSNGSCQWTDALNESVYVSRDKFSNKLGDCLLKFVVAMGSTRYGTLGEASVNMTSYTNASTPVSLSLKKCNHGTILQVRIHCLTQRKNRSNDKSKETNFRSEDFEECQDAAIKSEKSDGTLPRNTVSSPSKDLVSLSYTKELGSKESFSASSLCYSYDSNSTVDSIGRVCFSPKDDMNNEGHGCIGRQDSTSSLDSVPSGNYSAESPPGSNNSYTLPTINVGNLPITTSQESASSALRVAGSDNLLGVSADALDEIQIEAKMWEKNARKLMLYQDELMKECSDQSKKLAIMNKELSAAYCERDRQRKEVEELKLLLEGLAANQKEMEGSVIEAEGERYINRELEKEIKFQKESNASLELQLKRSQTSNVELVSALQELEVTVEKQKLEMEYSSVLQSKVRDMENSIKIHKEENENLLLRLQQLEKSEQQVKVKLLEEDMEQKSPNMNNGGNLNGQILSENTMSNARRGHVTGLEAINNGNADLIKEIQFLKEKIHELERDCNELTDENLDLLIKLKESKGSPSGAGSSVGFSSNEPKSSDSEVSQEKVRKIIEEDLEDKYQSTIQSLEDSKTKLQVKADELVMDLASKDEQIECLKVCQSELQAKMSNVQREKNYMEEMVEFLIGETNKCLGKMQRDQSQLSEFSNGVHCNISDNKSFGRKHEMELHLTEQKEDKAESSASITAKEAQLTCLTSTGGSSKLELQYIKSLCTSLQDEVNRLVNDKANSIKDLKQNLKDVENQWSEAQQKCEYMRRANTKLLAASETLVEECHSLRNSNEELKTQKLELLGNYMNFDTKFVESLTRLTACSSRVEIIEDNLSSLLEEISVKEKNLTANLDSLLDVSRKDEEIYSLGRSWWDHMQVQRIKNVRPENVYLPSQACATRGKVNITVPDPVQHVSALQTDKSRVEAACQELQAEIAWIRTELDASQVVSEKKVQGLLDELSTTKQKNELLISDNGKILDLLENYKSSEDDSKLTVTGLEVSRQESGSDPDQENSFSKIQILENRLAEALEANNVYKLQLQRLSKDRIVHEDEPRKIMCKGDMVPKEINDSIKSSLEAELNDIRERYLHMSLKCAEIEAQREELVMKLKGVKNGKRWFI